MFMLWLGKEHVEGTLQKSKFDADMGRIKELLKLGLLAHKIASLSTRTSTNASSKGKNRSWHEFGEAGNDSGFFLPQQAEAREKCTKKWYDSSSAKGTL